MNLNLQQPENASAHDRILYTAHHLFYKNGIRATGIDKIIKQAKVTKVTFYRHFPSKNDLILAFLNLRHQHWITWFKEEIAQHGNMLEGLPKTLQSWFNSPQFRGCAFINSVNEMGEVLPEVFTLSHQHKQSMINVIDSMLPENKKNTGLAQAIGLAIDGAIIQAQISQESTATLANLEYILNALQSEK